LPRVSRKNYRLRLIFDGRSDGIEPGLSDFPVFVAIFVVQGAAEIFAANNAIFRPAVVFSFLPHLSQHSFAPVRFDYLNHLQ